MVARDYGAEQEGGVATKGGPGGVGTLCIFNVYIQVLTLC